ncbi:hypothetical protein DESUT3_32240 [Desulfuromonas versatilis]|uniref:LUD domain-containing protein n=1 Tax=Desulfuromonas versatilis TaxID=2802975 RepID=A0ABM8HW52_9BACT|nr:lactate utilization protein [Desulfuromonas versatilis]BCR06155.1 hypothetical protein DESUT3_32240 [Desulfuromonas versatilis]
MPTRAETLESCRDALTANGFEAFLAPSPQQAAELFFQEILPKLRPQTVSWGDSLTLETTGVLQRLEGRAGIELIKSFEQGVPWREIIERRRRALLSDLFLTGSNAVTGCGQLVNLDMIGNRTAAIAFGPKKVVIFAGRNKLVPDLEGAMARIRHHAAPANAGRHRFATPCATTGHCHDCTSPQRICNNWSVMAKSYPQGRIKVVLIDAELGL